MEQLNNQLRAGILPQQLNYNIENACVDFSKLQCNSRYKSFEFYASKFPIGWDQEELFIPVIQMISDRAKINNITPLGELNKISNYNIEDVISNSIELQARRQL